MSFGGRNGGLSGIGVSGSQSFAIGQWGVRHGSVNREQCNGIVAWCPELAVKISEP